MNVKLRDQTIPQVKKFKYLKPIIQHDDKINDDVNGRIHVEQ